MNFIKNKKQKTRTKWMIYENKIFVYLNMSPSPISTCLKHTQDISVYVFAKSYPLLTFYIKSRRSVSRDILVSQYWGTEILARLPKPTPIIFHYHQPCNRPSLKSCNCTTSHLVIEIMRPTWSNGMKWTTSHLIISWRSCDMLNFFVSSHHCSVISCNAPHHHDHDEAFRSIPY